MIWTPADCRLAFDVFFFPIYLLMFNPCCVELFFVIFFMSIFVVMVSGYLIHISEEGGGILWPVLAEISLQFEILNCINAPNSLLFYRAANTLT